ncbi:prepilin peptidase [Halobacillus campisalis]|uniref:Prepilin peptidase n=1 Tax=Halobacillus campisalis TaxID=435909 RepID=A0ABW2K2S7_9BACI|nr:A24 family peptidase [Halobacillus campisalis]
MTTFFILYFFILGIILGSFYNVVGLRVPKGELFKEDRSYCPHCRHSLSWYELIPLLSFTLQSGKCRHCRQRISPIYPFMEFFSGLAFAASFLSLGFQFELLLALLLVSMFHIIVVSDLRYMIIPNKVLVFFAFLIMIYRIADPIDPWWASLAGGGLGFAGTALIIIVSRGGMGGGDMKLFTVIGFALGVKLLIVSFFLAVLIGTAASLVLMSLKVVGRKNPIPFGPFIAIGSLASYFYGIQLINWYLGSFF